VIDTVFLRVVNKGAASLLYLKDENGKEHFYIQKQQETPIELKFNKYVKEEDGKKVIATSEIYKGQLFTYFADCPNLKKSISGLEYKFDNLQSVFELYNQCQGEGKQDYKAKSQKIIYQFGLIVGVSKASLKFEGSNHSALTNSTFKSPINMALGITLNLVFPRSHQRWMIYNELLCKPYTAKADYTEKRSDENYQTSQTTFKMNYIGLGNMIRYNLTIGKIRPFINAGLANNISLNEVNKQETYSRLYTSERRTIGEGIDDLRKYEQALLFGAGVSNQRTSAEVRLELGNGISNFVNLSSQKKMVNFIIGYYFN